MAGGEEVFMYGYEKPDRWKKLQNQATMNNVSIVHIANNVCILQTTRRSDSNQQHYCKLQPGISQTLSFLGIQMYQVEFSLSPGKYNIPPLAVSSLHSH